MTRPVCFSCAATERDGAEFPAFAWLDEQHLGIFAVGSTRFCFDCMREAVREHERKAAVTPAQIGAADRIRRIVEGR